MRWATRARIHIDRAASAWLIRRSVDPRAEFVFVSEPDDVPDDATPFDMPGVDLSHHQGDCTFETILRRYDLTDPALWRLAEVVHEADLDDERFAVPEALGPDVVLRALSMTYDDERVLRSPAPSSTPCTSTTSAHWSWVTSRPKGTVSRADSRRVSPAPW